MKKCIDFKIKNALYVLMLYEYGVRGPIYLRICTVKLVLVVYVIFYFNIE